MPVQGVLERRKDELSLKVNLSRLSIEDAQKMLGRPEPVSGAAHRHAGGEGARQDPRLAFTAAGRAPPLRGLPPGTLPEDPLAFTLSADVGREDWRR